MTIFKNTRHCLAVLATALLLPWQAAASQPDLLDDNLTTIIVKVESDRGLGRLLRFVNGLILDEIPGTNTYLISVPGVPLGLPSALGLIEINEPIGLPLDLDIGELDTPAGTAALWYAKQPAFHVINAPEASAQSTGLGTVVAVIDARFDHNHPALAARLVPGHDFTPEGQSGDGTLNQSSVNYMFEDDDTALNQSSVNYMFEDTALNQSSVNYMFEDTLLNQSSVNYMFEDTILSQSSVNYMFEDTFLNQSSVNYMFENTFLKQSSVSYMFEGTILDESAASILFGITDLAFKDNSVVKLATPASAGYTHGTFTAGVVAAVAPDAQIMPLRAFDSEGSTSLFTLAKAIHYAVDNGADVINMSWGTDTDSEVLRAAIQRAAAAGITLVASAGNMNSDFAYYPAAYPEVIAVAATDDFDRKASFSSYGKHVLVSAPGVNIISAYPDGAYGMKSGTSFSAPMVAAQAALLKSASMQDPKQRLIGSSVDLDRRNPAFKDQLGKGRVDLLASLNEQKSAQKQDHEPETKAQVKKQRKSSWLERKRQKQQQQNPVKRILGFIFGGRS